MADYEQENVEVCKNVLKTKEGIDRLLLYHSSVGRFPNAPGAMIYPIYGHGELPRGFCRHAAGKGCLLALRMPVVGLLGDKDVGNYKGIKLITGQELFSHQLVLAPSFDTPPGLAPSCLQQDGYQDSCLPDSKGMVVRGICITKSSLKSDVANCLVFRHPESLCPEQQTSVRILQLSSNVAACPSGMFVVYLSTVFDDAVQGKKMIKAAINTLFNIPVSGNSPENSAENLMVLEAKPTLLWSILYTQELTMGVFDYP